MAGALSTPLGQSHNTCRAIVGQTPVTRCTCAASLNFSSVVTAAADCRNLPNRVPVLANPHEGSSIRNCSSASSMAAESRDLMVPSTFQRRLHIPERGHALSTQRRSEIRFRDAEHFLVLWRFCE